MKTHQPNRSNVSAFSLVEGLVTISVIGVMTAIAVQALPDINDSAHSAKAMRNAQNLVSIFQSAQVAGLDFYDADFATTVNNVVDGDTVDGGVFDGSFFGLPELDGDEQTQAMAFIVHDTTQRVISYNLYANP